MATISRQTVEEVDLLRVTDPSTRLDHFPDFMIVGPQRTGTTWIAHAADQHPQINFSSPKEIYFWNTYDKPDHRQHVSTDLSDYLGHFYKSKSETLKRHLACLKSYREFYHPIAVGEGTASYAAMEIENIQAVKHLNPMVKSLIMVRNPIQRAWAHAKKDLLNPSYRNNTQRTVDEVPESEFFDFFQLDYQLKCGQYRNIIENWRNVLDPENVFIGFFDDLRRRPEKLLLDIYSFIGVGTKRSYVKRYAGEVINPTDKNGTRRAMPDKYRAFLSDLFHDEVDAMQQLYGDELKN